MDEMSPRKFRDGQGKVTISEALRELIFGASDGLVSNLGLVTGVAAGTTSARIVLLAGVAGAISGAVSMASGNYLGVKSHIEALCRQFREEERSIREHPDHERAELVEFYTKRGLTPEEIHVIVPAVMRNKDFLLEEMAAHELGISPAELTHPLWRAFWIFIAFIIAAAVPVTPYALLSREMAMVVSIVGTIVALFVVGAARTRYTGRSPIRSGLEMLVIALAAGVAGYVAGTLVPV